MSPTILAPLIVLAVTIAALLIAIAIRRSFRVAVLITGLGLLTALASLQTPIHPGATAALFTAAPDARGFAGLIILASLAALALAALYLTPDMPLPREEYPLLLLLGALGAVAMAMSTGFIALFLGLETMSLAMIGMIAYPRYRAAAEEAALKYLVLSGLSSAIVLFGIALLELATGHLSYSALLATGITTNPMLLAALALIGVGAGFKLSVAPFHIWVPDIYAGAPAPSGAFIAVVPKIAVLAVIIRLAGQPGQALPPTLATAIGAVAILSMLFGNLLALMQENLKRIIGYSSIAHLGYLLVALLAASAIGRAGVAFYLVTYAITVTGAFGVIGVLSRATAVRDADLVSDYTGLFWTRPFLASVMTLVLLSLAGVPPAIGFIAKMYIMAAGVNANLRVLTSILVISSVIGLFYYLRIILVMAQKPAEHEQIRSSNALAVPLSGWVAMAAIGTLIAGFGVDPETLIILLKSVFG